MARIRSIKPDAFKSDSLSRLPREVRWTFAGLWTYLDDHGRGRYDPRLIKAELYPLNDEVTPATIDSEIDALEDIGSVCRYEVGGKRYIHAPQWLVHQKVNRPTASKLPPCDRPHEAVTLPPMPLTEDSVSAHGELTGGKGKGTGNREGNGEHRASADADRIPPDFAAWWDAYDHKKGKVKAIPAYKRALRKTDAETLLASAQAYIAGKKRTGSHPAYTMNPTTWLNGEHWNDETTAAPSPVRSLHASELISPPDGMDAATYNQWLMATNPKHRAAQERQGVTFTPDVIPGWSA